MDNIKALDKDVKNFVDAFEQGMTTHVNYSMVICPGVVDRQCRSEPCTSSPAFLL